MCLFYYNKIGDCMIIKNLLYNVIILYTLTYILKVRKKRSKIILAAVIGGYRIFIPLIPDIIMYYVLFRKKEFLVKIITPYEIIMLKPFMDTGCTLEYFGKNVVLLNENLIKRYDIKYFIPYKTIDSNGIIPIIKTIKVIVNKKKLNVLVAVLKMEEIELIMNPKIMEEIL